MALRAAPGVPVGRPGDGWLLGDAPNVAELPVAADPAQPAIRNAAATTPTTRPCELMLILSPSKSGPAGAATSAGPTANLLLDHVAADDAAVAGVDVEDDEPHD